MIGCDTHTMWYLWRILHVVEMSRWHQKLVRGAFELAGFVLPGVVGALSDNHSITVVILLVYYCTQVAGVQRAYLNYVNTHS
jgi:hypothetical protein